MHPTATESLPTSRADLLERLGRIRARTLSMVKSLSEDALNRVHDSLMSPVVWDLGHIATFEDLWLAQNAFGAPPLREGLGSVYDPSTAPRSARGELRLRPGPAPRAAALGDDPSDIANDYRRGVYTSPGLRGRGVGRGTAEG